ncbi:hypothetical protein GCM10027280_47460 [Micromonospora polyrhachis]|uniref:Uncharacterized protein n=1 Tax=Micromonospora polyrhachis TaxID=1282883 RepID=A0A7W7SUM0_9ACTN|nr:hypothetical protein [Micromonospora polyrhachis]
MTSGRSTGWAEISSDRRPVQWTVPDRRQAMRRRQQAPPRAVVPGRRTPGAAVDPARNRPLYCRMLGLRHVRPGGLLRFAYFEGAIFLGVLLGLAELVSWWGVLALPALVALMVKINDMAVAAIGRAAARVPEIEQDRFRREITPVVGRAAVPGRSLAQPSPDLRPAGPGPVGSRTIDITDVAAQPVVPDPVRQEVRATAGGRRDPVRGPLSWHRAALTWNTADRLPRVREKLRPIRQWAGRWEQPDLRHRLAHHSAEHRYE